MATDGRYEVQRYDASWGGWRGIPRAFDDDDPARYDDRDQAAMIAADYAATTGAQVRVRDRVTGDTWLGIRL